MKKSASIHTAWDDYDRAILDKTIADTIGIGEDEAVFIYEAAKNLVNARQIRAKS